MCCLCSTATKDLPPLLHSKATTAKHYRFSVVHTMSAGSPAPITSWADATDNGETLWATGLESTVGGAFVEPAVSVQTAVSTEPHLHTVLGADVQQDTSDEHESEDDDQPPYKKRGLHDRFEVLPGLLQCLLQLEVPHGAISKQRSQKKQSQFKGTDLHEMSMPEQLDEDRHLR